MASRFYQIILVLFVFAIPFTSTFGQAACGTQLSDEDMAFLAANLAETNAFIRQHTHLKNLPNYQFPVQIHVGQRSDGTGGLNANQINQILIQLNSDFAETGFEFYQCAPINYIADDTYYDYVSTQEDILSNIYNTDGSINIYFFNTVKVPSNDSFNDVCGYAYTPNGPDIIMMRNSCATSGNTMAHEMGHYFGLLHTHDTRYGEEAITRNTNDTCYNCDAAGDQLCDTNADPNLSVGVHPLTCVYTSTATASCSGNTYTNPPIDNIMSYSFQGCATVFTPQQRARMNFYAVSRSYLNCPSPNCAEPTNLSAGNITGSSVQLSWTSGQGVIEEEMRYRLAGYNWNYYNGTLINPISFNGFTEGNTYEFSVRSKCAETEFSQWVNVSFTSIATCNLPTSFQVNSNSETSVELSWTALGGATNYQVEYRPQGIGTWSSMNTTSASTNLTNLYSGTTYEFKLTVMCSNNPATTPSYTFTTSGTQNCPPISAFTFANITENSMDISWAVPAGPVTGYNLAFNQAGTSIGNNFNSSTNSFTLSNLQSGTNYQINIQTTCTNLNAQWSPAQYASTDDGCVDLQLSVFMEGALTNLAFPGQYLNMMRTNLNTDLGVLPGQTPVSQVSMPTPSGQPYNTEPWRYFGSEGASWSDSDYDNIEAIHSAKVVDWILVSLRTAPNASTTFRRAAALLMDNGTVVFPAACPLTASDPQSFYVVIEHRNHIGAMSASPVTVSNRVAIYDFTSENSYAPSLNGQKEVQPGVWALFTGESNHSADGFDINGADKGLWSDDNGIFGIYSIADFNLNGDINGSDKSCWNINNGISSGLKR